MTAEGRPRTSAVTDPDGNRIWLTKAELPVFIRCSKPHGGSPRADRSMGQIGPKKPWEPRGEL